MRGLAGDKATYFIPPPAIQSPCYCVELGGDTHLVTNTSGPQGEHDDKIGGKFLRLSMIYERGPCHPCGRGLLFSDSVRARARYFLVHKPAGREFLLKDILGSSILGFE